MFHVICTLPNASHNINGVPFVDYEPAAAGEERGVITAEPVDEEVAKAFAAIPGYRVIPADAGLINGDGGGAPRRRGRPSKAEVEARAAAGGESLNGGEGNDSVPGSDEPTLSGGEGNDSVQSGDA